MHQLDTSFKEANVAKAKIRKKKRLYFYSITLIALLLVIGVGVFLTADQWSFTSPTISEAELENELSPANDEEIGSINKEEFFDDGTFSDEPLFSPIILDLAGDPIKLNVEEKKGNTSKHRSLATPSELLKQSVGGKITIIQDNLLAKSDRLMTTLPSSQEDFAFFRHQKNALQSNIESYLPTANDPFQDTGSLEADILDAGGWGETLDNTNETLPSFLKTSIEDTTSLAFMRSKEERFTPTQEFIVRSTGTNKIETLLIEQGATSFEAKLASKAMEENFQLTKIDDGGIIAVRGQRRSNNQNSLNLVQISAYSDYEYLGTIAKFDNGDFGPSADPWVSENLLDRKNDEADNGPRRKYRLLDGIYSTATRNNVPSSVIGEAIIHLSKSHDLNVFALPTDKLILIYANRGRALNGTAGKVLYVGIQRANSPMHCFVFAPVDSHDFTCNGSSGAAAGPGGASGGAMVTPVKGVMTSRFGPRKHPILKTVRIHSGVDWAAPTGTPVVAAFDGTVTSAGDGRGYGNLVRIKHEGGRETRYAHLSKFSQNARPGTKVNAGDVIGYVGTTGLSTGPHLHFELRKDTKAIDPLKPSSAPAPSLTSVASISATYKAGSNAVERLVDKIIRVESAGNARAKNPLSSATGLGQFISSTWIRMMNTYRPDLARRLSRQELLNLRFNPTISREMVRNLAREGESYLRRRGHGITAGRLYLAHFLGMDGAHKVLRANPSQSLLSLMGSGVINANPFLRGKNVAYVQQWAERKMQVRVGKKRGKSSGGRDGETGLSTITGSSEGGIVVGIAPGFEEYRKTMERILERAKELI